MKKFFLLEHEYENEYKNEYENLKLFLIGKSFIKKNEFKALEEVLGQYIGNLETYKDLYRIILLIRKVFSELEEYELEIQMESQDVSYTIEFKERKLRFFYYSYGSEEDEHAITYSHNGIFKTTFSVKHLAKGYMLDDLLGNCIQAFWQEIKRIYFLNRLSKLNVCDLSLEQLLTEENAKHLIRKRYLG